MDKIIDITKIAQKDMTEEKPLQPEIAKVEKATNPIFKKLAQFKNSKLSKKFDITDLI